MSRVLKQFKFHGRGPNYDWDKWLDGRIHVLSEDVDFPCTAASMVKQLYTQATKRGKSVRITRGPKGGLAETEIAVQFMDRRKR